MAIRAVVLSLVCVGTLACWSPLEDGAAANAGGEAAAATPLSTGNGSSGGAGGAGSVSASNMWCTSELEVCNNRTDDDCDGVMDCDDPDCAGHRACRCPNAAEFETCGNGVDDDCDGTVDCEDTECASTRACVCPNAAAVETCDNGGDDDCDGAVDCLDADCSGHSACTRDCTSSEGNDCNGDLGYGDHCAAADNENGCSAARFWAWCNRRNPAYPDIWDNHLRGWVDDRCDGNVDVTQEQYAVYFCTGTNGTRWQCRTPLVLVMEQDQRVTYRAYAPGAAFDFSGNGARDGERHDWPTRATPWLALDLNGNGRIDSGRELFGTASPGEPVNGFLALAALDANRDGVVDAKDPQFHRLLAWRDDGDRVSQKRELVTVASLGIRQLPLSYVTQSRCDLRGNCEVERAPLEWRDRAGVVHTGALVDVHLRVQEAAVAPLVAARR